MDRSSLHKNALEYVSFFKKKDQNLKKKNGTRWFLESLERVLKTVVCIVMLTSALQASILELIRTY